MGRVIQVMTIPDLSSEAIQAYQTDPDVKFVVPQLIKISVAAERIRITAAFICYLYKNPSD